MRMHLWAVVVVAVEHFSWLPCRIKPGALAQIVLSELLQWLIAPIQAAEAVYHHQAQIQAVEAVHRPQAQIQGDQAVDCCLP